MKDVGICLAIFVALVAISVILYAIFNSVIGDYVMYGVGFVIIGMYVVGNIIGFWT
jgi:hypothetical protein